MRAEWGRTPRGSEASGYDVSYSYDALGNRLTKLEGGVITTYSYDEANQLSYDSTPALHTTLSEVHPERSRGDANGNTALTNVGGDLSTYSWDIENRMTLAELPTSGRTTATYDRDGKRRSYADSAGSRGFLWDEESIARETDGAGATVAAYSYAPSVYGALLSQRRSGATSFHHYDVLGSTMQLTDASQAATDSYLYRAFGEQSVLSGSSPNPFTWVGQLGYYRQPDTSDYWVRARVYGPERGRWVSRDPAGAGPALYRYVSDSPAVLTDPSGLLAPLVAGAAAALEETAPEWVPAAMPFIQHAGRWIAVAAIATAGAAVSTISGHSAARNRPGEVPKLPFEASGMAALPPNT